MADMLEKTTHDIVKELKLKFKAYEFTAPHLIYFRDFVAADITRISFRRARGPWIKLCNLWVSRGSQEIWLYTCDDRYIPITDQVIESVVREITHKTIEDITKMFYARAWTE